jgi:hypothetical protein
MILQTARRLGALALLAIGAVHLQQYLGADYRSVPTIGPLFLLNAIGSFTVAALLLAPVERIFSERHGERVVGGLAAIATAIAVSSLVIVLLAENGTVFGFAEDGYSTPIIVAIVAEAIATIVLAPVAAIKLLGMRPSKRSAGRPPALASR